jgi:hypothetical protein
MELTLCLEMSLNIPVNHYLGSVEYTHVIGCVIVSSYTGFA